MNASPRRLIRAPQVEAFRQAQRERFEAEMEAWLRARIPVWAEASREEMRTFVQSARHLGRTFGFFAGDDVRRWIALIGPYGLNFGTTPETLWACPLLNDIFQSPEKRLEALEAAAARQEKSRP
ncbi:MAG: hypothetical protein K2Q10_06250 [Rhodospirillales bacterium]|nr:hypothetical protein [Rhodospirillales bacterium]